jgi:hypothetical protein
LTIGIVIITLTRTASSLTNIEDVRPYLRPTQYERAAATLADKHRIYGVQRNMQQLVATNLEVQLADGQDPLLIEPYVSFMHRAGGYSWSGYQLSTPPFEIYEPGYPTSYAAQPNARLLGLVDVEVVLSRTPLTDPNLVPYMPGDEALQCADPTVAERSPSCDTQHSDALLIYHNQANAGPAYLVADDGYDGPPRIDDLQRLPASIVIHEQQPQRLRADVTSESGGWLVIGAPFFPGWVAQFDEQPAQLETIEGVLPAIYVGPGTHQLTYAYAPTLLYYGIALAITGCVLGLGWVLWERRGWRRIKAER